MKNLIPIVLVILISSMLIVNAQSTNADCTIDKEQAWIQSLLSEHNESIKVMIIFSFAPDIMELYGP